MTPPWAQMQNATRMGPASCRADGDPGHVRSGFGLDHYLDIVAEGREEAQQSLDRKAFELVVQEGGDLGLVNVE